MGDGTIQKAGGPRPVDAPGGAPGAAGVAAPLLPAPGACGLAGVADAMASLYTLMQGQETSGTRLATERVSTKDGEHQHHLQEEKDALDRARRASDGGRGFFGSLGKVVGDVVGDVATLHLHDLVTDTKNNLSDIADSPRFWRELESGAMDVAKWAGRIAAVTVAVSAGVAGCAAGGVGGVVVAAVAFSAAAASTSGAVISETHAAGRDSDTLGTWLELGGGVAGAGAGVAAGASGLMAKVPKEVLAVSASIGLVGGVAAGAAGMAGGAAHIVNGAFEADVVQANADALQARHMMKRVEAEMEEIVSALQDVTKSHERARACLADAMQTYQTTQLTAAGTRV
jgi:hypothetical protein